MADVIPDESLVNLLAGALGNDSPVMVRAIKNNVIPSSTTTLAQIQEADHSGYAPIEIIPAVAPSETDDGVVQTQTFHLDFEHDGGSDTCNIFGYMLTQGAGVDMKLISLKVDEDGPTPMVSLGDTYGVDLTFFAVQEV